MFRFLVISCLVSAPFITFGQTDITKVIPPSPDAASLGRFAETPVSHYTGVPNIQVPIWQFTNGDLNLSIDLSYHAGGVRVEEIASCTGLSWSLNAGGVITRSVVGLPDDYVGPGRKGFLDFSDDLPYDIADLNVQSSQDKFSLLAQYTDGCIDTESDSYFFNFAGVTGKFAFDWDKNVVIGSSQKIEIIPTYDANDPVTRITKWTVRTSDGTKYIFAARENSTQENTSEQSLLTCSGQPMTYTSSWYLTEIVSPNNTHTITFTYANYSISHGFSESESFAHKITDGAGCPGSFSPAISVSNSTLTTSGKRLSTISSSNGFLIEMLSTTGVARTDAQGSNLYSIDRIRVTHTGNVVKDFRLSYDYSNGGRLTLKSVYEKSMDGLMSKPPYQFLYNQTQLPLRTSKQQDYWGYYNSNAVAHLVPSLAILGPTGSYHLFSGANREPDAAKMKAGILEKVIYPTGGSQSFEYEPHDYGYIQSDDVLALDIPVLEDANMSVTKTGDNVNSWNSQPLVITHKVAVDANVQFSDPPLLGDLSSWMYPKVKITNSAGVIVFQRVYQQGASVSAIVLDPDTYTVSAFAFATNGSAADEATISLSWKRPSTSQNNTENLMAGGLRIKRITYSDDNPVTSDIMDEFSYVMRSDANKSSGVLLGEVDREPEQGVTYDLMGRLPVFVHEYVSITNTTSPSAQCLYLNRFSANRSFLGTTNGSHIGYREVVHVRSSDQFGKTIYVFDSPYEFNDGISNELPFAPAESFDHKRSLLRKKLLYQRNTNGSYQLAMEENYNYSYHLGSVLQMKAATYISQALQDPGNYKYSIYATNLGYNFLIFKETKHYQAGISDALSVTEEFQYGSTDKQLKEQKVTDSQGQLLKVNYSHPHDFIGMGNVVIDSLIDRHQYGVVVKKESSNGGTLKEGAITEFAYFGNLLLASRILQYESVPPAVQEVSESLFSSRNYKTRKNFHHYDSKGNILMYSVQNNMQTCFIWDLNKNFPIAQIDNAALNTSFHTSFEDESTNVNTVSYKTGKKSFASSFNVTLPSAGTYVLSYWKKTGAANWEFVESEITSNVSIGGAGILIDEVRLYRKGSLMSTFTHAPGIGATSISDHNNVTTYYEYDEYGRLKFVKDHNGNSIKSNSYNYVNE